MFRMNLRLNSFSIIGRKKPSPLVTVKLSVIAKPNNEDSDLEGLYTTEIPYIRGRVMRNERDNHWGYFSERMNVQHF